MEINVMGYNRTIDIDYISGLDEIHKEAQRIIDEDNLKQGELFRIMQNIQAERFLDYAKRQGLWN